MMLLLGSARDSPEQPTRRVAGWPPEVVAEGIYIPS